MCSQPFRVGSLQHDESQMAQLLGAARAVPGLLTSSELPHCILFSGVATCLGFSGEPMTGASSEVLVALFRKAQIRKLRKRPTWPPTFWEYYPEARNCAVTRHTSRLVRVLSFRGGARLRGKRRGSQSCGGGKRRGRPGRERGTKQMLLGAEKKAKTMAAEKQEEAQSE